MSKTGCLIIHGFTGGPFEVLPLANYLQGRGYVTLCPTLAGHSPDKKELTKVSWRHWLTSAEDGYLELSKKCDQIVLIGFSMGGLLAINLAIRHPASKLVTISAPIYPLNPKQLAINVVRDLQQKKYDHLRKYTKNSTHTPMVAVLNLLHLIRLTKPLLPKLRLPLLVVQGLADDTVHPKSAVYIFEKANSEKKYLRELPCFGHLVCLETERDAVFAEIYAFLLSSDKMQNNNN